MVDMHSELFHGELIYQLVGIIIEKLFAEELNRSCHKAARVGLFTEVVPGRDKLLSFEAAGYGYMGLGTAIDHTLPVDAAAVENGWVQGTQQLGEIVFLA